MQSGQKVLEFEQLVDALSIFENICQCDNCAFYELLIEPQVKSGVGACYVKAVCLYAYAVPTQS